MQVKKKRSVQVKLLSNKTCEPLNSSRISAKSQLKGWGQKHAQTVAKSQLRPAKHFSISPAKTLGETHAQSAKAQYNKLSNINRRYRMEIKFKLNEH